MDWKEFFKPNIIKIVIFIVLVIIVIKGLFTINVLIFPCKVGGVFSDISTFKDGMCSFVPMFGGRRIYSPITYIELFIILIIIPYLIACGIGSLFRKKSPQPI